MNPEEEKDETQKLVKQKAATLNPEHKRYRGNKSMTKQRKTHIRKKRQKRTKEKQIHTRTTHTRM